jgi:hypothetical protein
MRDPLPEELETPEFNAVWNAIKGWDIERYPGDGYHGCTGTDVITILDALGDWFKVAKMNREGEKMKTKVVAVHKWETANGTHDVHVWYNSEECLTFNFEKWREAERFALLSAKGMGLTEYTVDEPKRPHIRVTV